MLRASKYRTRQGERKSSVHRQARGCGTSVSLSHRQSKSQRSILVPTSINANVHPTPLVILRNTRCKSYPYRVRTAQELSWLLEDRMAVYRKFVPNLTRRSAPEACVAADRLHPLHASSYQPADQHDPDLFTACTGKETERRNRISSIQIIDIHEKRENPP